MANLENPLHWGALERGPSHLHYDRLDITIKLQMQSLAILFKSRCSVWPSYQIYVFTFSYLCPNGVNDDDDDDWENYNGVRTEYLRNEYL